MSHASIARVAIDDEATLVAKLVFLRLDPLLRMLCEAVKAYHGILKAASPPTIIEQQANSCDGTSITIIAQQQRSLSSFQERNKLGILRSVADLLEELQTQLESLMGKDEEQNNKYLLEALQVMMDYVTLPLLAILRTFGEGSFGESSNDKSTSTLMMIEQSAVWKCIERASRVLLVAVQRVSNTPLPLLPASSKQKWASYIDSCVAALPSGAAIVKQRQTTVGRLDKGEDCLCSLLATLQSLIIATATTTAPADDDDVQQYGTTIKGVWMTRILDSSIALLEPSNNNNISTSSISDEAANNIIHEVSPQLQLQAVQTVQAILHAVRDAEPWRGVFPGVYAGLYRRILASLRVSHAQPNARQVVLKCVAAIGLLLRCSLQGIIIETPKVPRSRTLIVKQLLALSIAAKSPTEEDAVTATAEGIAASTPEEQFFREVQQRLPATLTVLVNMLTTARSSQVREQAVALDRVLLIDTRSCWSGEDLVITTLESCLVLCRDSDENVAPEAARLVQEYSQVSAYDIGAVVAPRIIDLVERLASLAQSSREMELQASLKLITGYLTLGYSKAAVKQLRSSLSAESVSLSLRQALTTILDVQFDTFDARQSGALVLSPGAASTIPWETITQGPRLLYMQDSTARLASDMIRALGGALGPKHVAVFVDACIADLYRACVERAERHVSLEGHNQVRWLHEWIGAVRLAREMLVGGFAPGVEAARTKKNDRKRVRLLLSLSQSILPIITTYPLWDLPTSASVSFTFSPPATKSGLQLARTDHVECFVSSAALRGNAAVSCALLGLVGSIVTLVGDEVKCFTPVLLYPILEKAGQRNVGSVREVAVAVLQSLAIANGSLNISALIADSMESSLMGTMLGRIRVPGGRALSPGTELDDSLLAVVDCATTVLRITTNAQSKRHETPQRERRSMLSYMEELTQELATRFDHASTKVTGDIESTMSFIHLFDAAILLLRASRETPNEAQPSVPPVALEEPWFELLAPFKKIKEHAMGPKVGFEAFRKERAGNSNETDKMASNVAGLTRDIGFVSQVAWRCGYLLSHASLKVQIQSCNVMANCFAFLGWVASDASARSSEANGPKTAVMRQVHASWSAIGARLNATCTAVTIPNRTSLIVVSQQPTTSTTASIGEQRVYLTKLLALISEMTECSDDFMATRFREMVWPCESKILRGFSNQQRQRDLLVHPRSLTSESSSFCRQGPLTESEFSLVLATIQCLSRVFGHRPVGIILSGLIPGVGSLLFPFLEEESESLVSACTDALHNLLRIDSDSLWRPLIEMSGRSVPLCPLNQFNRAAAEPPKTTPPSERLARKANDLLLFVESLPEQTLD